MLFMVGFFYIQFSVAEFFPTLPEFQFWFSITNEVDSIWDIADIPVCQIKYTLFEISMMAHIITKIVFAFGDLSDQGKNWMYVILLCDYKQRRKHLTKKIHKIHKLPQEIQSRFVSTWSSHCGDLIFSRYCLICFYTTPRLPKWANMTEAQPLRPTQHLILFVPHFFWIKWFRGFGSNQNSGVNLIMLFNVTAPSSMYCLD